MRSIFLLAGIIGVIGLTFYFGVFKNNNFNDNGFQFAGKVDLQGNVSNSLTQDINQSSSEKISQVKSSGNKTKVITPTTVTAIIAPQPQIIEPELTSELTLKSEKTKLEPLVSELVVSSASVVSVAPVVPAEMIESIAPIKQFASAAPAVSSGRVAISEILVGIDGNADYEFIELYNPTQNVVDLTGWSIKKRSSSGSETALVSNKTKYGNFKDKKIMPGKYLLLAQKDGYNGSVQADILYSGSLAYKNNAVVLYNSDGKAIEDIGWDEITKGQSLERVSWSTGEFKSQFSPNPQNSSF